ncbi:MAG: DUF1566 domain-containing protein [Chromatiaceae bacterium]|nr:DUF1566 domain-containing protein [Chromatiaceae bacterium]
MRTANLRPRPWVAGLGLCLALGATGAAAVQTCKYDSIPATAPGSRFTDNGDGTVTDKATGLQWKRCSEGQTWSGGTCTGYYTIHIWQGALQLAEGASYAGKSDWRLPNIRELASIVEHACYDPAVDLAVFPNTPSSYFWSSSPYVAYPELAWLVDFVGGGVSYNYKINSYFGRVRLVRGGQ